MSKFERLRVHIPPIEALRKFPNWTPCLDEELELIDADTLLKVASNQTTIDSSIALTAAVASIDGLDVEAAVGAYLTLDAGPEYAVFYRASRVIVFQEDALEDFPFSSPVRIRSVLPRDTGEHIEVEIDVDGEFASVPSPGEAAAAENAAREADLKAADELFRTKDFYGAVRLFRKHETHLSPLHRRKLQHALSKCDEHFL